jgi:hypothetical protein
MDELPDVLTAGTPAWRRGFQYLRNCGYGFYRGSVAERRWIVDELARDKPVAILGHYGNQALKVLPIARRAGVPVVAHFNGFDLSQLARNPR